MTSAARGTKTDTGPYYLLFAGTGQPPRGGLGDLVGTFTSEQAARAAFREIRLQPPSEGAWAQLAVVEGDKGVKPLCWFGIGASPDRMARPRVSRRITGLLTGDGRRRRPRALRRPSDVTPAR